MIKNYLLLVVLLCLICCFPSCRPEDPNDPDNQVPITDTTDTTGNGNNPQIDSTQMLFSASVNGVAFAADTADISYQYDADLGLHVFTAPDGEGHIVTLMLNSLAVGSYEVDFDNAIVNYQTGLTVYTGGFNPEGNVTITHNENNRISGTFNAELFDFGSAQDLSVTNGHFVNLSYQ